MEVIMKRIADLKPAKYNPWHRTESHSIAGLMRSIKKHGILSPVLISQKDEIVDGHRRIAAAKALGLKEVPTVATQGNSPTPEEFEAVNTHQKRLGPRDMIYIYVHGGNVPEKVVPYIGRLEALIGADALDEIADMFLSYRIIDEIQRVASYCHRPKDDNFKRKVFHWYIHTGTQWSTARAMADGISPTDLANAILKNKPLARRFGAPAPGRPARAKKEN